MALLLLLSACATVCPPTAPKPFANAPLKMFRNGGVLIENQKQMFDSSGSRIEEFGNVRMYARPYDYRVQTIIEDAFLKPGQPGFAEAKAARIVCSIDNVMSPRKNLYNAYPGVFSATITLVDPNTNKPLFSKHYQATRWLERGVAPDGCQEGQSAGMATFDALIGQCLTEFGHDVRMITMPEPSSAAGKIDGTLTKIRAFFAPEEPTMKESFLAERTEQGDVQWQRIAQLQLPDAIKSTIYPMNFFNNSSTNQYEIVTQIVNYKFSHTGMIFAGDRFVEYTARIFLKKNGKVEAFENYKSDKFNVNDTKAMYEKHSAAVLVLLYSYLKIEQGRAK